MTVLSQPKWKTTQNKKVLLHLGVVKKKSKPEYDIIIVVNKQLKAIYCGLSAANVYLSGKVLPKDKNITI